LILKINLKKYYFNIFLNKKYFQNSSTQNIDPASNSRFYTGGGASNNSGSLDRLYRPMEC
jgi:hypothetical protein